MQSDTEQLAQQFSDLQLGSFKTEFDKVIEAARKIRPDLSDDEINITKELAKPSKTGGLLVLLLQPRRIHPWVDKLDAVIKTCVTLESLEEGLRHCGTDLKRDVSLLDLWPCLPERVTKRLELQPERRNRFRHLVLGAIEDKKPDCILCLGKEPSEAIQEMKRSSGGWWRDVSVVYDCHPSFVFQHNKANIAEKVARLEKSIREAADQARRVQRPAPSDTPSLMLDFESPQSDNLYRFMCLLLECCFPLHLKLPEPRSEKREQLFVFKRWEDSWLKHAEEHADQIPDEKTSAVKEARASLIPVLKALNQACKLNSFFGRSFEFKDEAVISAFSKGGDLAQIEANIYVVVQNGVSLEDAIVYNHVFEEHSSLELDTVDFWEQLGKVVARGTYLWELSKQRATGPQRTGEFLGFGLD
ncbi:hypothetical protein E4U55_002249 [Claviceps digitariae]|nr:hypothetical protein E4U55_002249 [Claviceps digitariae]